MGLGGMLIFVYNLNKDIDSKNKRIEIFLDPNPDGIDKTNLLTNYTGSKARTSNVPNYRQIVSKARNKKDKFNSIMGF